MAARKRKCKTILDFYQASTAKSLKTSESDENNNLETHDKRSPVIIDPELHQNVSPAPPNLRDSADKQLPIEEVPREADTSEGGKLLAPSCSSIKATDVEKTKISGKKEKRSFQKRWLQEFSWVEYHSELNVMTCKVCLKHRKSNVFTKHECRNWKTSTLTRHAESSDHKEAVIADSMTGAIVKNVSSIWNEKEAAVICALKSAFWLAKENLAITKFESLVNFLTEMNCPDISNLKCRENVSYTSDKAAEEFIHSIAHVVRKKVEDSITRSPYVSLLCDETTDISVTKKLSVYCRIIDPDTLEPSTHFVTNVAVDSGTGKAIHSEMKKVMVDIKLPSEKVMGLGTDGAKAMTGMGEGLTGYMTRDNPMLVNYHCVAHRLALVTAQAADGIPYLVDYQSVLTGIFYYFKASAVRSHKLITIQELLDEPILKVKEVHQVRWMSVYIAVETIYKILDSLITFFTQNKDAKGKGYQKKMIQYDFIATTYLLMDVLPVVSQLCLVFQKADIDVSLIKVHVENCKRALNDIKSRKTQYHLDKLQNEDLTKEKGKFVFKSNHIVQGKQNIDSIKQKLVDGILKRLEDRFPDNESNLIYAFAVLSMRPISFCSQKEREAWGNEKVEILLKKYGQTQQSEERGDQPEITKEPIVDPDQTRKEWAYVKDLVVQEGYPRDRMSELWFLLLKYYGSEFPNLLTLVKIGLSAPVHTADCERGFSAQNMIKTGMRNRLSPETVDDLLTIRLEGGDSGSFDYQAALAHWRKEKERRIFHTSAK